MCLILFSIHDHPTYKLIVAANRDEFYQRKTAPAAYWNDHPEILGGRDLEAMGTWMGINRNGKVAMVTNYRDLRNINPKAASRGKLVSDFLIQDVEPEKYLLGVEARQKEYNGFNLLAGNGEALFYFSNYGQGIRKLERGFFGLSNHLLETPWPKVVRGKEKMAKLLKMKFLDPDVLLETLNDELRASDQQLPDTGVGLDRERALSSMFIKMDNYGTRCSTVLLIDYQDNVSFTERVYNLTDFSFTTGTFQFQIRRS
jgi:uncharacterized protein with NRDE domain